MTDNHCYKEQSWSSRCNGWFTLKSGGGPPHIKTLVHFPTASKPREASWSAPVLWRFGRREEFIAVEKRC